nr:MAG TPA: hypothetical protein [Microviridae sp.]
MCEANPSYLLGFSRVLSINAQLTLHHKWSFPTISKKNFGNTKINRIFAPCRSYNYY